MEIQEILSHVDHTLLRPDATWPEIRALCDEGLALHTASVCIPPLFVAPASAYLGGRLPVCTVIGFPNGYTTAAAKAAEARRAVKDGAAELDMVIAIGLLKEGRYDEVLREIRMVRRACSGRVLKVIVETCLLTDSEKIRMCRLAHEGGADYIKTSTGFSTGGATPHDVRLLVAHAPQGLKVKASGGIRTPDQAREYRSLGADRLGTSGAAHWAGADNRPAANETKQGGY